MDEAGARVKVRIYGQDYTIAGDRDEETIREIASYVDGKMREVGRNYASNAQGSLAVLAAINVAVLNSFEDGAVVDAAALIEKGIISDCPYGLKVLSNGNLTKNLTVKAAAFSESAKQKIEQAGGKAEVV